MPDPGLAPRVNSTWEDRERASRIWNPSNLYQAYAAALEAHEWTYATAIRDRMEKEGLSSSTKILADAHATFVQLTNDFKVRQSLIAKDLIGGEITQLGAANRLAAVAAPLVEELDAAIDKYVRYVVGTDQALNAVIASLGQRAGDTNAQLLAEMRIGRSWDRIKSELGADPDLETILQLIKNGDRYEIAAILAEIPALLRSLSRGDEVDFTIAAMHATLAEIDPRIGQLAKERNAAQKMRTILDYDASIVRNIITTTSAQFLDLHEEGYLDPTQQTYDEGYVVDPTQETYNEYTPPQKATRIA